MYSDGIFFAIVDLELHPEYAKGGSTSIGGKKVTIVTNIDDTYATDYALLYESNKKPSDEVIESFSQMRLSKDLLHHKISIQNLHGIYLSIDGNVTKEYELISFDMFGENSEEKALLYIRENGKLLEGYPVEVSNYEFLDVKRIMQNHKIVEWESDYTSPETTDSDSYYLSVQDQNDIFTFGHMNPPERYVRGIDELVEFFDDIEVGE